MRHSFLVFDYILLLERFKHNRSIDWLLFGVFAALGTLSHYLFLYLLLAISVFLLYAIIKNKTDLKCLALFLYFLILTPI